MRRSPSVAAALGALALAACSGAKPGAPGPVPGTGGAGGAAPTAVGTGGGRAPATDGAPADADVVDASAGEDRPAPSDAAAPDGPRAASFSVSGYVTGLPPGGSVTLRNGGDVLTVGADGAFTFAGRLGDGAAYAVVVDRAPGGRLCRVTGGAGTIARADVVAVAVACLSDDATLAALSISPGALAPAFVPDVAGYAVAAFPSYQLTVLVRATPSAPGAGLRIGGRDAEPGAPVELSLGFGAQVIEVAVTAPAGTTRAYTLAVARRPITYIKPSNTRMYNEFGLAIALSGDTLAVGSPGESSSAAGIDGDQSDEGAPYSGAVYLFSRAGSTWAQEAYVKASHPHADDELGYALALDGDTLVVGAHGAASPDGLSFAGAAHVFERTAGRWAETALLEASNAGASDAFGAVVALSGDTIAIGASGESSAPGAGPADDSAASSGAVYLFERASGSWRQTALLKASNAEAGDRFGSSVAIEGDTLVVGARNEASAARGVNGDRGNNGALFSGAAYVFVRAGGAWSERAYLKASNTAPYTDFGASAAVKGDVVVIGSPYESSASTGVDGDQYLRLSPFASRIGAAYVFVRNAAGGFVQQAYLKPFGGAQTFGVSVAVDRDGTVVVGSTSGLAYTYARSGGSWTELALLNLRSSGARIGGRVAIQAGTIVTYDLLDSSGATGVDPPPTDVMAAYSGAVYVFQ